MSQLLQVATRQEGSAVAISNLAPNHAHNGLWFDVAGILAVDSVSPITHHHQGLPFVANGALAVDLNSAPDRWAPGGVPFSLSGRVVMDLIAANHYSAGIPYNAVDGIHYAPF